MAPEYAVAQVQEFPHGGHQGTHFGQASMQESSVVSANDGIVADSNQSGHKQGATDSPVALFADPRWSAHGLTRLKQDDI